MHTVLDTNIVISALLFRGSISAIYREIVLGRIQAFISPPIFQEYAKVLAYPKFRLTEEEIIHLLQQEIGRYFQPVEVPLPGGTWIREDPSDDCFINTAIACPSSVLVSGDRHILEEREKLPVPVFSAREFLEKLQER